MTDARVTLANARVAHVSLRGQVAAERFVEGVARRVAVPVADVRDAPGGKRQRQVLYGQTALVLEERDGFAFGAFGPSRYCGYVATGALAVDLVATHSVTARMTHLYTAPEIKAPERLGLSHRSALTIVGGRADFLETHDGFWVPRAHVAGLDGPPGDPVSLAEMLLGTPYLWGGNSAFGIDCSGLVLAAFGTGPGDSDLQSVVGDEVEEDLCRGDLVFWKGHVAIVVDGERLIHANAHHMAVAYEGIAAAAARIAAQGEGKVIARRRIRAGGNL